MSLALVEPGDEHRVAIAGAVNPGTVTALHRTIDTAVAAGHRVIVIDLSAVTLLGAQTAGLFCGAIRLLERRGATVEVLGAPPRLQQMLTAVTGLRHATRCAQHDLHRSLEVVGAVPADNDAFADPSTADTAA
ncbi:MAG: hypothetical protein NVS4B6_28050 [Mycobacterium sp.]